MVQETLLDSTNINRITGIIVDSAYQVHYGLGPGLLESVYELVLAADLERKGLRVERQKPIDFEFDGLIFEAGFRVDLLVESCVVVELKSVEVLAAIHSKQVLTYIRLMNLPVGLLINFGATSAKEGINRIMNSRYRDHETGEIGRATRFDLKSFNEDEAD